MKINNCLLCNSKLQTILELPPTPLANEFVNSPQKQDIFPLNLMQCVNCSHVQLDYAVEQERLFRNYLYVTGTSPVNRQHFQDLANKLFSLYLKPQDYIIDIEPDIKIAKTLNMLKIKRKNNV